MMMQVVIVFRYERLECLEPMSVRPQSACEGRSGARCRMPAAPMGGRAEGREMSKGLFPGIFLKLARSLEFAIRLAASSRAFTLYHHVSELIKL